MALVQNRQPTYDLTDPAAFRSTKHDSCVTDPRRGESKKVWIVRKDDSLLAQSESDVFFVISFEQSSIGRCSHVDLPATKAVSDGVRNVLIQMETKHMLNSGCRFRLVSGNTRPALLPKFADERFVLA